jgi:hypothetical protein
VDAASHACLGEDSINFEFNQHLLVHETAKRMPDGRVKILDLSWSAITDETGTIVRLMLCVRDVTELRALAAETSDQKRRLEMIGEILAINQEKFHHFIESSSHLYQRERTDHSRAPPSERRGHCRAVPQHAHDQGQRAYLQPAVPERHRP